MDHLIDNFDVHIEWATDNFIKEWKSGKYKKFKECPSYKELKVLIDSVNILRDYVGMKKITIKGIVGFYCE